MNNLLLDYIKELIMRLGTKSPKFFKIIGIISAATALATGLPGLFQELNINLPDWAEIAQNKIIAWAATTAFFISKLTTQSTAVAITTGGEVLKKTNDEKLPFTAKAEDVAAHKEGGVLNAETAKTNEVVSKIDPLTKT